jgi:hypothetical protein
MQRSEKHQQLVKAVASTYTALYSCKRQKAQKHMVRYRFRMRTQGDELQHQQLLKPVAGNI